MSTVGFEQDVALVFVHLGTPIPPYLKHNLHSVAKRYPGRVLLATDSPVVLRGVETVDIASWYNRSDFDEFRRSSPLDRDFRGGFWLHAAERLFVLPQLMKELNLPKLFHIESDVLILNLEGLAKILDDWGLGIFAPMEDVGRAIASVLYVNNIQALEELARFARKNAHLGNEMSILGQFMESNPTLAHSLVSDQYFDQNLWPLARSTLPPETGLTDATAIGMWLFGWDPRNSQHSMYNHRIQSFTRHDISSLRFLARPWSWKVKVHTNGDSHELRSVHVHSKIFGRLRFRIVLAFYCWLANAPFRTIIAPKWASPYAWMINAALRRKPLRYILALPKNIRQKIGRSIVILALRSPRIMSNRQFSAVSRMLAFERIQLPNVGVLVLKGLGNTVVDPSEYFARENRLSAGVVELLPAPKKDTEYDRILSRSELSSFQISLYEELQESRFDSEEYFNLALGVYLWNQPNGLFILNRLGVELEFRDLSTQERRIPVIISDQKHIEGLRHASDYWKGITSNKISFSEDFQIYRPEILREMFGGSPSNFATWVLSASTPGRKRLSLSQSYGSWLLSKYPRQVALSAIPPCA